MELFLQTKDTILDDLAEISHSGLRSRFKASLPLLQHHHVTREVGSRVRVTCSLLSKGQLDCFGACRFGFRFEGDLALKTTNLVQADII